ncbi:hypothetical protein Aab01nite_10030 [Paractinoplanes abujensis]|uniref:Uncharacterized protein (TIGR03083 family) n=1 Tax=Paractinoplanes abujensis TaxID=882441 RepID=A0A7W7CMA1_9ACTN|nr:maleylpyruvate isomerase N-terminal domain-containing protein [Actinoplanes abujensis]MBB4691170.1 uncharacterized protein (TIGR03083 family) [Actinoplanes abujensis]GID17413.1 hypothetical protein Aab01nite_10030 [Actinoplanes abujensis]
MKQAFLGTAAAVSGLLHCAELTGRWQQPSALPSFRVSGLAGHLARAVFNVERWLETPSEYGGTPIDAVAYYLAGAAPAPDLGDTVPARIRETGEQEAAAGPAALAAAFDAARARLGTLLPTLPPDRPVQVFAHVMPLEQCLLTRLVELTVHLDDLAVSLDRPTPPVPPAAADAVTVCLARLSAARHGFLPVLRTLSRRERVEGPIAAF